MGLAHRATNLTFVKRWIRRGLAAVAVGALATSTLAPNAAAEYRREPMPMDKCAVNRPSSESQVMNAWHLERLRMNEVWRIATGKGIKIAVIDTGLTTLGSPYFDPEKVTAFNLLPPADKDFADGLNCMHGTGVVSLIAASRGSQGQIHPTTDFAGIAPDADIVAYRTLYDNGEDESVLPMIMAIEDAIKQKVDVINISQTVGAGDPHITQLGQAVARALDAGIVVVAAAGNTETSGLQGPAYPASFPGVISVGMINKTDAADPGSWNMGPITIGAPGTGLIFLSPSRARPNPSAQNQSFQTADGTSYASPIVAGVVALMLEQDRQINGADSRMTPDAVRKRLIATADRPASTIPDKRIGFGIINPMAALVGPAPAPSNDVTSSPIYPTPFQPKDRGDQRPVQLGLGLAVGAVSITALGLVAAIAIPAAVRRNGGHEAP